MSKKILYVDDDLKYAEVLIKELENKDYIVAHFSSPIEAITEFANTYYDVVVTSAQLKEMDGIKLLKILKGISFKVKSIVLAAFPQEDLELESLNIEVDRFLSKEKSFELIIRYIDDLMNKRHEQTSQSRLLHSEIENIVVDSTAHKVKKDEILVELSPKEFHLLELFLNNKGTALTREDIAMSLWDKLPKDIDDKAIEVLVHNLRRKLNLVSLSAVRGIGYRWNE